MNKNKLIKLILVLVMGIVLLGITTNAYAATGDNVIDLTNSINTNTNINTNTGTNTNTGSSVSLNTNTTTNTNTNTGTNNYNTNLPHTGIAENTMLGIALTVLVIIAIYAYKKVNEYKNI